MLVKVTVGDNDDRSYKKDITVSIPYGTYATIVDCMNHCSVDEYDRAWDELCNAVHNEIVSDEDYREDWIIDHIEED